MRKRAKCSGARLAPPADHLDRDQAVQADLAGHVDDAHAALAELLQELVAGDRGPRRMRAGPRGTGDTSWRTHAVGEDVAV